MAAMKARYKFYLAFENSLCQEYITEKFWKALNEGLVHVSVFKVRPIDLFL